VLTLNVVILQATNVVLPADQFSMWKLQPDDCEVRPLNCNIVDFIAVASVEDLDAA
jgi:hypothetical protein